MYFSVQEERLPLRIRRPHKNQSKGPVGPHMMDKHALVYVELNGTDHLVGRLWGRMRKGTESATFEYDKSWLAHADRFALEPALRLGPGPFYAGSGKPLFGAIGDSAPDRWGRVLMRRAERRRAERARQTPRTLWEIEAARPVAGEVGRAVETWRAEAARLGLTATEIDRVASAFEHEDLQAALKPRRGGRARR